MEEIIYKTGDYVGNYTINRGYYTHKLGKWSTRTFKIVYKNGYVRVSDLLSGGAIRLKYSTGGHDLGTFVELTRNLLYFAINANHWGMFKGQFTEDDIVGGSLGKVYITYADDDFRNVGKTREVENAWGEKVKISSEMLEDSIETYVESHGVNFAISDGHCGDNHLTQEIFLTIKEYPTNVLSKREQENNATFKGTKYENSMVVSEEEIEERKSTPFFPTHENPFKALQESGSKNKEYRKWRKETP